jgi:DNA-binding transcriptional regulator of glucitol operon
MMRRLLTPRWMAFTALMFVAAAVAVLLAWWQLERYEGTGGSFQNLGYTLQWPVFGAFAIYLWWRLLRDASKPETAESAGQNAENAESKADTAEPEPTTARTEPANAAATQIAADEKEDPELAAYNRYLAGLAERPGR